MKRELEITYATLSNSGGRKLNEDYLGCSGNHVFVLCDGLGGHGSGEVASRFVVEQILSCYEERGLSMEESIQYAQDALLEKQEKENAHNAMKTTVVCLELLDNEAKFAHVGDSRVYLFENGKYKSRSLDHSIPQMLVQRGIIKEKDIRHHEDRSRLLCVMGAEWNVPKYQVADHIKTDKNTTFLLCSDGFWELIDEKLMSSVLKKSETPEEWLAAMEHIIIENGQGTNMDNYSAIAVFLR
ncbi:MAG: serine/threonine-protein phosphatase [Lachnospiraceae bacterium]|nr:serine/threonine-protein phosphatase [Lachnospiraceae bacterium]